MSDGSIRLWVKEPGKPKYAVMSIANNRQHFGNHVAEGYMTEADAWDAVINAYDSQMRIVSAEAVEARAERDALKTSLASVRNAARELVGAAKDVLDPNNFSRFNKARLAKAIKAVEDTL